MIGEIDLRSWYIDCDMSYVNCVPEDSYQVIFTCDGTGATVKPSGTIHV